MWAIVKNSPLGDQADAIPTFAGIVMGSVTFVKVVPVRS